MIIQYFKEVWDIEFRPFLEKSKLFSIATRTNRESDKFIEIIKPYIEQVPSMLYKIRTNFTKKRIYCTAECCFEARDVLTRR